MVKSTESAVRSPIRGTLRGFTAGAVALSLWVTLSGFAFAQEGKVVSKKDDVKITVSGGLDMKYIYRDGGLFYFMDKESFDQVPLEEKILEDLLDLLQENQDVFFVQHKDQIIDVALPDHIVLEVAEADPGFKGDTATGGTKPAVLVTGATIQVPLFILPGEKIKIDTRERTYIERVST